VFRLRPAHKSLKENLAVLRSSLENAPGYNKRKSQKGAVTQVPAAPVPAGSGLSPLLRDEGSFERKQGKPRSPWRNGMATGASEGGAAVGASPGGAPRGLGAAGG